MKKSSIIIVLFSFKVLFAQYNQTEKFFITPVFKYNFSGVGAKVNLGYNINEDFSIIFSSGYMTTSTNSYSYLQQSIWDYDAQDYIETTYSNAEQYHKFVPIDLSLRYNFNLIGLQSYVFYQAGWNFLFNEGNYNVSIVTKFRKPNQIIESKTGKATDIYNFSKTTSCFGYGIGVGVLIPLSDLFKIDISYSLLRLNYHGLGGHSVGVGLSYVIK